MGRSSGIGLHVAFGLAGPTGGKDRVGMKEEKPLAGRGPGACGKLVPAPPATGDNPCTKNLRQFRETVAGASVRQDEFPDKACNHTLEQGFPRVRKDLRRNSASARSPTAGRGISLSRSW